MAFNRKKVIDIALAEVGYLEKETKSQLDSTMGNAGENNYTKYARDLDTLGFYNGRKQGAAWCDVFVDWCFVQAYGKDAALALTCQPTKAANNCGAGCKYSRQYYQTKGQLHSSPQPGDQVFFYNSTKSSIAHTGLVYDADGAYVYTVEGNTSSTSGVVANGGAVAKKKYKLTNSRLAGYGRPGYGSQEGVNASQTAQTKPVTKYPTYTVQRGESLWTIAREQLGKGTRYREIMELNGLKSDLIKVGQVLKLPIK
ncbi:MAG: LysM peptidoglycan-binding domain-containing protein [Akkermansia sp.]|nr:LysM peptidoglycan-binding domain-containing protein [Akkermansia sp.]